MVLFRVFHHLSEGIGLCPQHSGVIRRQSAVLCPVTVHVALCVVGRVGGMPCATAILPTWNPKS